MIAETYCKIKKYSLSSQYFKLLLKASAAYQVITTSYHLFDGKWLECYAESLLKTERYKDAVEVCEKISKMSKNTYYYNYAQGFIYHRLVSENSNISITQHLEMSKCFLEKALGTYNSQEKTESMKELIKDLKDECNEVHQKLNNITTNL